jgi:cysteine desulfuration protein SufE
MTSPAFAGHPFGATVTQDSLRQIFGPLNQWEDKYRQLILLGKQLPALPEALKIEAEEIAGCENRVWLGHTRLPEGTLHFYGESEGRIVRGLLAVLLTAIEGKTADQLLAADPLEFFDELGLRTQLSASRNQGLNALRDAVLNVAHQA